MTTPVRIVGSYLSLFVRKVLVFLDLKGFRIRSIRSFRFSVMIAFRRSVRCGVFRCS